jgi:hypothetical protein
LITSVECQTGFTVTNAAQASLDYNTVKPYKFVFNLAKPYTYRFTPELSAAARLPLEDGKCQLSSANDGLAYLLLVRSRSRITSISTMESFQQLIPPIFPGTPDSLVCSLRLKGVIPLASSNAVVIAFWNAITVWAATGSSVPYLKSAVLPLRISEYYT